MSDFKRKMDELADELAPKAETAGQSQTIRTLCELAGIVASSLERIADALEESNREIISHG